MVGILISLFFVANNITLLAQEKHRQQKLFSIETLQEKLSLADSQRSIIQSIFDDIAEKSKTDRAEYKDTKELLVHAKQQRREELHAQIRKTLSETQLKLFNTLIEESEELKMEDGQKRRGGGRRGLGKRELR
jgi:hypothetical protein